MIIKIILLILCGSLAVMNLIYLRDNADFYKEAEHKGEKFLCTIYEINFIIKILNFIFYFFLLIFNYLNKFKKINQKFIYFFYFDNFLNILINLFNQGNGFRHEHINLLFLQLFFFLIIFIIERINSIMEEVIAIPAEPVASAASPVISQHIIDVEEREIEDEPEMWGSIYNEGYNFENAYENNGYNNCYSDNAYDKEGL
jgi:hypothetical protein